MIMSRLTECGNNRFLWSRLRMRQAATSEPRSSGGGNFDFRPRLGLVVVTLAVLLLAGCMVGPKYHKPFAPMTPAFKEPLPEQFKEWKTAQPGDRTLRANWWEIFGDPQLNSLEEQVAASNQSLKVAEARFQQARAMIRFNRAAQFPTISAGARPSSLHPSAHRALQSPN